ncbi:MAG TPA: helix-turn-helix transcriptional regulator [Caulobacteraceae bacterium]|jgi:transcriptional regulator with XRE-family HTH domain|nr:helix-turn-helix transcriptional regulator [Caulobacteraceae bacterium]
MTIETTEGPGHYIREWRKYRGLSQTELADSIAIHRTHLNKIERGKRNYAATTLTALASRLDCEPGDLIQRRPGQLSEFELLCQSLDEADRQLALKVLKHVFRR